MACALIFQAKLMHKAITTQSLFQQSMELADLIVDMNRVFTKGTPAASTLKFLTHVD